MRPRIHCSFLVWRTLELLSRAGALRHLSFTLRVRIMGNTVRVPIKEGIGREFLMDGEPWARDLFGPLLAAFPGTFLDVGVNLGQTLAIVRSIEPERAYIGFEPNPVCVAYARHFASVNGFAQAPVLPFGIGIHDEAVRLEMHSDDPADPGATVVPGFRPSQQVRRHATVRLLSFPTIQRLHPVGRIGFLKIDVEGGEREVLRTMEPSLRQDRPAVLLEILPTGEPPHPDRLERQRDIESLLRQLDYVLIRIHNRPDAIQLERMEGPIGAHADQELANLIALPAERCDAVLRDLRNVIGQR